jgi:hypothetical protein
VVGISMVLIGLFIEKYVEFFLPKITGNPMIDGIFYTGLIAHFLFEFSGVNLWYSKEYCKLIE